MTSTSIEIVVDTPALLGECPVWSDAEQVLYWIDIDGRALHRYDPATGMDEWFLLPGRPGSIALTNVPGRFLAAVEHQVGWLGWELPDFEPWVDLEPAGNGNRMNDGRCDPAGRFWVGSMHERPSEGRFTGMLHRLEADGTATVHRTEVGVSNALAFSPDGMTMYWADTFKDMIWAHDYDVTSGTPGEPRAFADFSTIPGRPDGACVDADGCVWVACVQGSAVVRFTPDGRLDRRIDLPVDKPTMPAFGGRNDTLYITSIGAAESASAPSQSATGGVLLALNAGVRGLAEPMFVGEPANG